MDEYVPSGLEVLTVAIVLLDSVVLVVLVVPAVLVGFIVLPCSVDATVDVVVWTAVVTVEGFPVFPDSGPSEFFKKIPKPLLQLTAP